MLEVVHILLYKCLNRNKETDSKERFYFLGNNYQTQFIELINGTSKEINIKNQAYYFFDDIISIKNFHLNLLEIDKKLYKDIHIYYIGYIRIKKFGDCENIHIVNSFNLIIHFATEQLKEKNDEKFLILDLTDKYEEVLSGIKSEIKTLNGGKEFFKK